MLKWLHKHAAGCDITSKIPQLLHASTNVSLLLPSELIAAMMRYIVDLRNVVVREWVQ